jgi:hypothetical protein
MTVFNGADCCTMVVVPDNTILAYFHPVIPTSGFFLASVHGVNEISNRFQHFNYFLSLSRLSLFYAFIIAGYL